MKGVLEVQDDAWVFRGTRIKPSLVLRELARGTPMSRVLDRWPTLTRACIAKALKQGAQSLSQQAGDGQAVAIGRYLEANPRVCHGRLVFKGTRVPVETALTFIGRSDSIADVLADWPQVPAAALQDAIRRAARTLTH